MAQALRMLAAIACFAFAACAAPGAQLSAPDQRMVRDGYAVLPPPDGPWFYTERQHAQSYRLMFWQPQRTRTYARFALVSEEFQPGAYATPQDLLQLVHRRKRREMDPERFRLIMQQLKLDPRFGAYSVAVYTIREERTRQPRQADDALLLRTYEYRFAHPRLREVLITVQFNERGRAKELDPDFAAQAQAFFAGILLDGAAPSHRIAQPSRQSSTQSHPSLVSTLR